MTTTDTDPTPLVDVSDMPLADLLSDDNTVLDEAIRRVLRRLAKPHDAVSAFNSAV